MKEIFEEFFPLYLINGVVVKWIQAEEEYLIKLKQVTIYTFFIKNLLRYDILHGDKSEDIDRRVGCHGMSEYKRSRRIFNFIISFFMSL